MKHFALNFTKKFWDVVGDDVTNMELNVLNNGGSISAIKKVNIVLIPKKNKTVNLADFRPISLYNVIYKIISKCLVNRY